MTEEQYNRATFLKDDMEKIDVIRQKIEERNKEALSIAVGGYAELIHIPRSVAIELSEEISAFLAKKHIALQIEFERL